MSPAPKDSTLKKQVKEILENCKLDRLLVDREVQINVTGETDDHGNLIPEKEIDVVAKLTYRGKKILLLFECENSGGAAGIKKNYKDYEADIKSIRRSLARVQVTHSTDHQLMSRHFREIDIIRACFVYGEQFPESAFKTASKEADKYGFTVWNHLALTYYRTISGILGRWTRYELFKDFSIDIEPTSRFTIKALKLRQKDKVMYVGKIHPGLLLKIAYVVRRASERKFAYQRMLSKDRIAALGEFISSDESQNFLPNTVLIVFDPNMRVRYDAKKQELTAPLVYCSAWIIDGQHRVYGFLGTKYEDWTEEEFEPFDLPLIVVRDLPEADQTRTFININYFQKRIKAGLLCDLSTLTRDLRQKLTWASLIGRELNFAANSPLKDRIKISELHGGRSIGLSSLAQFALLETLLGYRQKSKLYSGPLFEYAPFDRTLPFDSAANQAAFHRQLQLLIRFLVGVRKNTASDDPGTDPWRNTSDYALLRPTGINALFMLLSKILVKHPDGGLDFGDFLSSLNTVSFKRDSIAKQGGGWKGFRNVANLLIRKINKGKSKRNKLSRFGTKEKA